MVLLMFLLLMFFYINMFYHLLFKPPCSKIQINTWYFGNRTCFFHYLPYMKISLLTRFGLDSHNSDQLWYLRCGKLQRNRQQPETSQRSKRASSEHTYGRRDARTTRQSSAWLPWLLSPARSSLRTETRSAIPIPTWRPLPMQKPPAWLRNRAKRASGLSKHFELPLRVWVGQPLTRNSFQETSQGKTWIGFR